MSSDPTAESRSRATSLRARVQVIGQAISPEPRSAPAVRTLARTNRRAWFLLEVGRPVLNLGRPALSRARDRI